MSYSKEQAAVLVRLHVTTLAMNTIRLIADGQILVKSDQPQILKYLPFSFGESKVNE